MKKNKTVLVRGGFDSKINAKDAIRINELKNQINRYDTQYYEDGVSDISDAEYDRLYDEYLSYVDKYPSIATIIDSPTKKVGAGQDSGKFTGLPKFTHKSPLLSIDKKGKTLDELKKWYAALGDNVEVIVEPKLDGITCNLNYEYGKLVNAVTRGNGYIGDVITENFRTTDTKYPEEIGSGITMEIRGEAIIPYDFFKKNLTEEYSNPRNAVAGIMRQMDSLEVKGKGVQVMFYDYGLTGNQPLSKDDYSDVRSMKHIFNFQNVPIYRCTSWQLLKHVVETRMDNLIQEIDGFNVLIDEDGLYPQAVCDGLVIKVNNRYKREEIGFSEKGPKWAFAFKFKPLQATTRIDHVEWQVGKSGRVTPVAVFNEISLGGTKITRATLNNADYMRNLPLLYESKMVQDFESKGPDAAFSDFHQEIMPCVQGRKDALQMDDKIIVERSNDVIPRIVAIAKHQNCIYQDDMETTERLYQRRKTFDVPTHCPDCGQPLSNQYPLLYCTSSLCPSQITGKISHFASRDAMNIIGLGDGVIEALYKEGFLTSIPSLYHLKDYSDKLKELDFFGTKKVEKLLKAIEGSKTPELWQFIYSLSIEGVGKRASKDLAQRYHTLDNFLNASIDELLMLEDMGEITSKGIVSYISNERALEMIYELVSLGVNPKLVEIEGDNLKGKTFVITGTLEYARNYYQEIIEKNGGKVSGSVSKKTTAVLIGKDAGSKEEKARGLVAKGENILLLDTEDKIKEFLGI